MRGLGFNGGRSHLMDDSALCHVDLSHSIEQPHFSHCADLIEYTRM